ncbi:hypothetical protein [Chryseobacterium sp. GP-SGM7]|uniref:hypothetical protein n=1 Tax=Chryseobacterium sp. GP-SGM7 TaxID=3411323 RepID=UPI003B95B824
MKFYLKVFSVVFFCVFIFSCSPAHTLFVKNNTNSEKEIFVELIENKFPERILLCKELVSDENLSYENFPKYYKNGKCFHENINIVDNKIYKIKIPAKYTVNITPNNSIYPYQKIYYLVNGKKCFINDINSESCVQKISQQPKLVSITEILQ